jgi:hypothetical protein
MTRGNATTWRLPHSASDCAEHYQSENREFPRDWASLGNIADEATGNEIR